MLARLNHVPGEQKMLFLIQFIVVLILLVIAVAFVAGKYYKIDRRPDSITYARTTDGWNIALSRYLPEKTKGRKKRLPVLLCHGLSGNHFSWDLTKRFSLARTLTHAGYEVFLLDLRGSGWSDHPRWFSSRSYNWNFDDYLQRDVPAAIDHVLERTGAKKLHWIGHSMGGMLAYCLLQSDRAQQIQSASILSSPGRIYHFRWSLKFLPLLDLFSVIHMKTLSRFAAPFARFSPTLQRVFGNLEMPLGYASLQHANNVENLPATLLKQFATWVKSGRIVLSNGQDITAGLSTVTRPMFLMVGSSDATIRPDTVREVYDAVASRKKEFHLLGPDQGQADEYGHQSVLFGRNADTEVFPRILAWLESN